jgi:predicted dehydrogenase
MSLLRIGVIGAGHFGRFHALKIAASQRAALVGLTDLNPERAALVGRELGGVPAMGLADLLDIADAVIVAAPAEAHYDIAALALERGRHVLVEKPIAATLAQADRLAALARAQNRVLQVGHLLRTRPFPPASPARSISRPPGSPPSSRAAPTFPSSSTS